MATPTSTYAPPNMTQIKSPLVCYAPSMISMGGVWKGENPLDFSFPLFLLQLLLIVLTTRATAIVLQLFRQPRYLAEIIGGLILGPTVLGRLPHFGTLIFPLRSVLILETMANFGLVYFIFIVGVEIDPSAVHRSGRSASFAAVCIAIPFLIGTFTAIVIHPHLNDANHAAFLIFLCVILSVTAFSVLARTLAELKLLNTSLGTTALTSSMLVDSFAWVLLALAITLAQNDGNVNAIMCTLMSGLVFYMSVKVILKPAVEWVANRTPEGEEVDDFYACLILVTVLVVALIADVIGIHAISGAFIFGLVIPNGALGEALIERIEDFIEGLLLPLFFATSGLKMNLTSVADSDSAMFVVLMMILGTLAKVGGCAIVARLYDMNIRDGISMGLLMNTKGVIEMVLLNIGRDRQLLSEACFSVMVCLSIIITAITGPLLRFIVQPTCRLSTYNRRTVAWPKPDAELRVILCVHSARHVPATIALLDYTNPSKSTPITVFALHLIELTARASAMMILNTATAKESYASNPFGGNIGGESFSSNSTSRTHSDQIMHAFEMYEQHTAGVSVQPLTAVSSYSTMYRDICVVAEINHAALIILPFHKQQTVDGGMEATNPAIRTLNQMVLNSAPCSVGILVDRGLQTAARFPGGNTRHLVTLLFIGGPDDREAIAIASRMVEHPGINIMIVRFVMAEDTPKAQRVVNVAYDEEDQEKQADDDCISDFRLRFTSYKSVTYIERIVSNSEEMVEAIRETMDGANDLYIVGRGNETTSPLTVGLTDWSECPELGAIGDLLASADFGAAVSVLVVQNCMEKSRKLEAMKGELSEEDLERRYDAFSTLDK